jgi:hypothetical protein
MPDIQEVTINRRNSPQLKRSFTLLNAVESGDYGPAINVGHGFAFFFYVKATNVTGTNRVIIETRDSQNNWATWKDILVPTGNPAVIPVEAIAAVNTIRAKVAPYEGGTFTVTLDVLNVKAIEAGATPATIDWSALTNKPATFSPSTHTHDFSEVTGALFGAGTATISAAGNTNVALAAGQRSRATLLDVQAGSGAYTHTVTLQNTNADAGRELVVRVNMTASTNPTIDVRNLTSTGTQLALVAGALRARVVTLRFRFDGTNWALTGRCLNDEVITQWDLTPQLASRAVAPVAYSDGVTPNRRIEHSPGAVLAGGLPVTINVSDLDVPTSNPSTSIYLAAVGSSSSPQAVNSLLIALVAVGGLQINVYGATASDYRVFSYPGFRAAYSGRKGCKMSFIWPNGDTTTNPTILIDNVDISANFALTTGGTAPNWLSTALDTTKFLVGNNWPAGRAPQTEIGLGAWTLADHQEWVQTGRKPTWWELGTGSAVPIISPTVLNGGFETAGAGGADVFANWQETVAGTSTVNRDTSDYNTAGSGTASLRLDVDGSNSYAGVTALNATAIGRAYTCELWAKASVAGKQLSVSGSSGGDYAQFTLTTSWQRYSVTFIAVDTAFNVKRANGISASLWADDVTLRPLGPIIKPISQPGCPVLPDSGANMLVGLATPGITILGPKPPIIEIPIPTMSADGFILADQVLVPEGYKLTDADIQRVSGTSTGTVTIRETSSSGTVLATATLGATPVEATRSNVFSAGGKKLHLTNSSWSSSTVKGRLMFQRYQ